MEKEVRYCQSCKKKHAIEVDNWTQWHTHQIGKKKVYYCNKGMFCVGCGKIHPRTPYIRYESRQVSEDKKISGWWCEKWVSSTPLTPDQKMKNMSPQEVVSGVHYGMERQSVWGADTEDHSVQQAGMRKELAEALNDL